MIDQSEIQHHIQKHIIAVLYRQKVARFRDLRKPGIDTNLFAYHLKLLTKNGFVQKLEAGYSLGQKGLSYVDRISEKDMNIRSQPKIVTMLVVQNSNGDVLLWRRNKQPYIDTWTLPYGKTHLEDKSILAGAKREWQDKLGQTVPSIKSAGSCYIRVQNQEGKMVSSTLVHIFYATSDQIELNDKLQWARPHKLSQYELAPAVEKIVTRTFFKDNYFFEEFDEVWYW